MAVPVDTASVSTLADAGSPAQRWKMELEIAKKPAKKWEDRGKKILRRYLDDRVGTTEETAKRFNILWSNIQTLQPAIYARAPKPVVERRYLDRDPVARLASMICERCIDYELKTGYYHASVSQAVQDYLLPGRGTCWVRYEPTYSHADDKLTDVEGIESGGQDEGGTASDGDESSAGDDGSNPQDNTSDVEDDDDDNDGDADVEVLTERLCVDYVHWTDFLTNVARTWEEVTWVAKRAYLTRDELIDKFGKEVGSAIPLDHAPAEAPQKDANAPQMTLFKKATIWEIWDKTTKKVFFLAEHYEGDILGEFDDPLKLKDFWPCPKPIFATITNDSIIPTPDYTEYQDQAEAMDELTARISKLVEAIKAIGTYDSSVPELRRLFEEGEENKLYPVDSWAAFAEKGGVAGAVSLLPVKELAEVLMQLYEAREKAKQDLYEVTGISDIVRGQTKSTETATAQQIKSNFATLRLDSRKAEVQRFCRDLVAIMGEMICEHFSPKTMYEISGFEQYAKDNFAPNPGDTPPMQPQQPPMPLPPPQMGDNGGPPMDDAGAPQTVGPPPPLPLPQGTPAQGMMGRPIVLGPSPEQMAAMQAAQRFEAAVALLRNDKLRGFKIDIETDSTVAPDQMQEKKDRTEFITAATQFIAQAEQIAAMDPTIVPLLGKMLLFGVRAFPTARDLESSFEEWINKAEIKAAQPRPPKPDPELIKAQAAAQAMQQKAQIDQQQGQQKMQQDAQQAAADQQTAQIKAQAEAFKAQADMEMTKLNSVVEQQKAENDQVMMRLDAITKMMEHHFGMQKMAAEADLHNTKMQAQAAQMNGSGA